MDIDEATRRLIEREANRQDIPPEQLVAEAVEAWIATLDAMNT